MGLIQADQLGSSWQRPWPDPTSKCVPTLVVSGVNSGLQLGPVSPRAVTGCDALFLWSLRIRKPWMCLESFFDVENRGPRAPEA